MRASIILFAATLSLLPSVSFSQDSGLVGGRVGSDLDSSAPAQQRPSVGNPYGSPVQGGPIAGRSGNITAGQTVPKDVPVYPRAGGVGSAIVDGHRVWVDPNSNRILKVF